MEVQGEVRLLRTPPAVDAALSLGAHWVFFRACVCRETCFLIKELIPSYPPTLMTQPKLITSYRPLNTITLGVS